MDLKQLPVQSGSGTDFVPIVKSLIMYYDILLCIDYVLLQTVSVFWYCSSAQCITCVYGQKSVQTAQCGSMVAIAALNCFSDRKFGKRFCHSALSSDFLASGCTPPPTGSPEYSSTETQRKTMCVRVTHYNKQYTSPYKQYRMKERMNELMNEQMIDR